MKKKHFKVRTPISYLSRKNNEREAALRRQNDSGKQHKADKLK